MHKHFLFPYARDVLARQFRRLHEEYEFYRVRFQQAGLGPTEDPSIVLDCIPVISSDDLRDLEFEVFQRLTREQFLTDSTSGTTGERKLRYASRRDDDAEARLCRRFFRGCCLDQTDSILALDIDSADIYLFYGEVLRELGVKEFLYASVPADFGESISDLLTLSPSVIITVPTLLQKLLGAVESAREDGGLRSLKKILYLGESMPPLLRKRLEENWGVEVFSFYGTTETGSIAGECSAHCGVHVYWDSVVPTLIDPIRTRSGPAGEVAWTTLHLQDQPLVKYLSRDLVTLREGKCSCGQRSPRMVSIRRKEDDFSLFGEKFTWEAFARAVGSVAFRGSLVRIEVRDLGRQTELVFRLPQDLQPHEKRIAEAVRRTGEIKYLEDLEYLRLKFEFLDGYLWESRKLRRVVDRRSS